MISRERFHESQWDKLIPSYDDYVSMSMEERSKILDKKWHLFKELSDSGVLSGKNL